MLCIKCKEPIPDGSLFCNYCGAKQAKTERASKKRGNGQVTVYKDGGKGSWIAEVTLGYYMKDGKRCRKSIRKYGFRTKKEAVNYLSAMQNGVKEQKHVTVALLWEQFSASAESMSKSKRTAYNIAWRKIQSEVEYRWIDDFTVPELQALTDSCGTSYYTKRDIKNLLSHFYKIAIWDDYADKNKAAYIQLPPLEKTEREIFTDEDVAKLWEDYRTAPSEITAQMLLMLYTGIRPGELLTIRKENVHISEHYMTGGIKTKKGKNRKIILPDKIIPLLEWMISQSSKELITNYNKSDDFYNLWIGKRQALGIREQMTPYCCRHTHVTRLTALKVSPAMLQELAGHEDYDTTLEYTHLSVDERLQEVNRLW